MLLDLCESTKNVPLTEGISWWLTKTINCLNSICISAGKHILHDTWILILASYPQTLAECHWEVFCVAPYSGLLVFGQLWLGAIYNFLKRWTVVTHPNGTGMFLCYGFLSWRNGCHSKRPCPGSCHPEALCNKWVTGSWVRVPQW